MEWDELVKYHLNAPRHLFRRRPEIDEAYRQHKNDLHCSNRTLAAHVLSLYFGNPKTMYVIVANMYPYDLAPGIQHLLLWINPRYKMTVREYSKIIDAAFDRAVYFENADQNKSIPGVRHIHIFVRT